MDKIFNIDGVEISLPEELIKDAKCHMLLDDNEYGNYLYIDNCIRANICETFDDLANYSIEKVKEKYTNKQLSEIVINAIKKDISERITGNYENDCYSSI